MLKISKYNYTGSLTLNRSRVLPEHSLPKDDVVNWLFLNTGERQYSFVYNIINPLDAFYDKEFQVELAFTMDESIKEVIKLNNEYEVLRGQEVIGSIILIELK